MNGTDAPPATAPDLKLLAANVLGDLGFLLADTETAPAPAQAQWLEAEITYAGTAGGVLRCWCTHGLAAKLAANLLAIEPDEGDAQIGGGDALREFLNVLCGQLVTAWHGALGVYNLSIPTVRPCDEPPPVAPAVAVPRAGQISVEGEFLLCTWEPR